MGNFSRDPNTLAADAAAKHYVAVRMQQAVPVLDADWNLLEDLRRREFETMGRWFIGDGVPSGNDGFNIVASGTPNDFTIRAGLCIVGGKLTVNDVNTTYATQPNFSSGTLVPPLTALTTPAADKSFIVCLDVFEEEVDSLQDSALIDSRIGIETAIRLRRNWAVRVLRIPEDVAVLNAPPAGHLFLPLAQLNRTAGNPAITTPMIVDLRDTQLSIKRKIEVRNNAGNIVVDNARFQTMLQNTRDNLLAFIKYITSQFNPIFTVLMSGEILGLQAADHIARAADAGLALVNSSNLANQGALKYMGQLYAAEQNFLTVWRDVMLQLGGSPKKYLSYTTFLQRLDDRLHLPNVGALVGLQPALNSNDLAAAVAMQEEIARLFGAASANLPRGAITVFLYNSPPGNLTNGQLVRFEFHVRSATTLADTYSVDLLPQVGWPRSVVDSAGNPVPGNKVAIGPTPAEVPIFVNVNVQPGSSGLQLRVTSTLNPDEITQVSNLFMLNEGSPAPPGEQKIQFNFVPGIVNGTLDATTGVINVQRTKTCQLKVQVVNTTGSTATFNLGITKQNDVGGWTASYVGDAVLPLNNGAFASEQMNVTPSAGGVSTQILFTASTTIQGSPVSGNFLISFVGTP